MHDNDLSQEEIETPRSAADLHSWVVKRIESIAATPNGKSAVRFRAGLCKPLIEELLPLGLLCERLFERASDVSVTPVLGSQNYDAVVDDRRSDPVPFSRIEVTQGHEEEDEYLRMLHLEREGHSSLLGPVSKSGTKKTGISVSVQCVAKSHTEVVSRQRALVWAAIHRKLNKKYDPETALLVVFDDSIAIQSDADCEVFRGMLEGERDAILGVFAWAGVIGWGQKCFAHIA